MPTAARKDAGSASADTAPVTELAQPAQPDDGALVRRALSGDRWAEEALYRRHVRSVTNATTRLLGRIAEADDVVQDTFVCAFERLGELADPGSFRGWAHRIAVSMCHRRFRRMRLMRALGMDRGSDDATLEAQAEPGCRPEAVAALREIDATLRSLPTAARSAWILHRVEGWTLEETSTAMTVSLATVKRRIAEADQSILERCGGER